MHYSVALVSSNPRRPINRAIPFTPGHHILRLNHVAAVDCTLERRVPRHAAEDLTKR